MKNILMTTAAVLALSATNTAAGGLSPPVENSVLPIPRPAPPTNQSDFSGFYAGAQFSKYTAEITRSEEYTPQTEIPVTDSCVYANGHSKGSKCDDVPTDVVVAEFGDLPNCGRDYSRNCIVRANDDGTVRIFIKGAENGDVFEYETGETTIEYGETVMRSITEAFTNEEAGVFAGYRVDLGVIAGFEITSDAMMQTIEASVGHDFGGVLAYGFLGVAQYDGLDGTNYGIGADVLVGDDWLVGIKGTIGDFDSVQTETIALRVGYQF